MNAAVAFRPLNLILLSLACPSTANLDLWISLGCWITLIMHIVGLVTGTVINLLTVQFDKTFWSCMVSPLDCCFAFYLLFIMKTRSSHLKLTLTNLSSRLNSVRNGLCYFNIRKCFQAFVLYFERKQIGWHANFLNATII